MKKADKIQGMLREHETPGLPPEYAGYFTCFNRQEYYEAHDVLEHLWLRTRDGNHAFYKGLIQFAGAFVHLQKQYRRPDHPKDASRAKPAARLFGLAAKNLEAYRPAHLRLDVERVWKMSMAFAEEIARSGYRNPWTPETAPRLEIMKEE
ncbi:MAG TPA: DUF309 domain-containing protein [Chthoniobacteraceae bacterium]|nr:DUF309 domain-containing protein [Chthoniobacteraceae bacterium]